MRLCHCDITQHQRQVRRFMQELRAHIEKYVRGKLNCYICTSSYQCYRVHVECALIKISTEFFIYCIYISTTKHSSKYMYVNDTTRHILVKCIHTRKVRHRESCE